MSKSKLIKGASVTGWDAFGTAATNGDIVAAFNLSRITMGYLNSGVSLPSSAGDEYAYFVTEQDDGNNVTVDFGASTQEEAVEDLITLLTAYSETGRSFMQTESLVDTTDEKLKLNGEIIIIPSYTV